MHVDGLPRYELCQRPPNHPELVSSIAQASFSIQATHEAHVQYATLEHPRKLANVILDSLHQPHSAGSDTPVIEPHIAFLSR